MTPFVDSRVSKNSVVKSGSLLTCNAVIDESTKKWR